MATAGGAARAIHYTIGASQPASHLFEVRCVVARPDAGGQRFALPAWIPGSYLIRDFARHVVTATAHCAGKAVAVEKIDKSTWQCAPCDGPLSFEYSVYAYALSVRGAYLDLRDGFFNGVNVFVAVAGQEHEPVGVTIEPPAGCGDWRVATAMTPAGASLWQFGDYAAADYDELIDHPVAMGRFDIVDFDVAGTAHHLVLSGRHRADTARLRRDVSAVCAQHAALFGELPDMGRYLFLTRVLGEGYGGLEHRSSSALMCQRDELPAGEEKVTKGYRRFLGLVSHEYFHLWHVKRIKPAAFTPYALHEERYTRQLWVFEGVTSYYDDLALVRSGVIETADYLALVGETLANVFSVPGHRVQSLADSSFDAWTKFYKPTPNTPNAVVSYYAKGALVALALDLLIRAQSAGRSSLDDVMRALWAQYGAHGVGVPEGGFEALCAEVTELDLAPFFAAAVHGTEPLDLTGPLRDVGIVLTERADAPGRVALGCKLKKHSATVGAVFRHSAAERAGLAPGDHLVALDGLKISGRNWSELLKPYRSGDTATLHVFRRDELLALDATFDDAPPRKWRLKIDAAAPPDCAARREAWLGTAVGGASAPINA